LEAQVAGQRIGYVRVSTLDQNEKRQLESQVLDRVFTDKASGRDTSRPELTELLRFARNGDTVVVHSMDRLARNLDDLRALVQGLTGKGVRVEFVKESLVFTGEDSPMANLMLSVMGAFAEFERSLIRERQREGIALAQQRGAYRGRKKSLTPERAAELVQRAAGSGQRAAGSGQRMESPNPSSPAITASAGKRCTSTSARPNCPDTPPVEPAADANNSQASLTKSMVIGVLVGRVEADERTHLKGSCGVPAGHNPARVRLLVIIMGSLIEDSSRCRYPLYLTT
jgi:DNA invertase Pin-like site-specific DNA recombinase